MNKKIIDLLVHFTNWTLQGDCDYSVNDEDSWQHNYTGEQITTEQLVNIYLQSEEIDLSTYFNENN